MAKFLIDVIVDILQNLPVKSLLRFKCVCKGWRSIISDPDFVKSHLNKEGRQRLQIVRTCLNSPLYSIDCESSVFNNGFVAVNIDFVPMNIRYTYLDVIGCSHGLLCLLIDRKNIVLCNPITREFRELPCPPTSEYFHPPIYGFGYDSSTDDYKVIMGFGVRGEFEDEYGMKILALKTNTWRRIQNFDYDRVGQNQSGGVLVNGVIHWVAISYTDSTSRYVFKIVGLDLAEEKFIEVVQPDHSNTNVIRRLAVLRGCLCLEGFVDNFNYDIWLMKEYGVGDSWIKLISYPLCKSNSFPILLAICFMNNGEILIGKDRKLYIYNLNEETFKEPEIYNGPKYWFWFDSWSYKESLVSPNKNLISPNEDNVID